MSKVKIIALLMIFFFSIAIIIGCSSVEGESPNDDKENLKEIEEIEELTEVTITAVEDVMVHESQFNAQYTEDGLMVHVTIQKSSFSGETY